MFLLRNKKDISIFLDDTFYLVYYICSIISVTASELELKGRVDVLINEGGINTNLTEEESYEDDLTDLQDSTGNGAPNNSLCPGEIE